MFDDIVIESEQETPVKEDGVAGTDDANPIGAVPVSGTTPDEYVTLVSKNLKSLLTIKRENGKYKVYAYGRREYDREIICDALYDWLEDVGI